MVLVELARLEHLHVLGTQQLPQQPYLQHMVFVLFDGTFQLPLVLLDLLLFFKLEILQPVHLGLLHVFDSLSRKVRNKLTAS